MFGFVGGSGFQLVITTVLGMVFLGEIFVCFEMSEPVRARVWGNGSGQIVLWTCR